MALWLFSRKKWCTALGLKILKAASEEEEKLMLFCHLLPLHWYYTHINSSQFLYNDIKCTKNAGCMKNKSDFCCLFSSGQINIQIYPQKHTSGLLQIQRNLFNGEVSVERGDLFAHDKEMFDKEELPVYLSLWRKYKGSFYTSEIQHSVYSLELKLH